MIVYVEGIPASGKTTVLKRIEKRFPESILYVPEYVNVEEGKRAEMSDDQGYFMRNDGLKWRTARESTKDITFVDRGHLSTVIYNLAAFQMLHTIECLNVVRWYFEDVLANNRLPDSYVFIRTEPSASLDRRRHLLTPDNIWDHQEALEFANEFYPKMMKTYELAIPILTVLANSMTVDQVEQHLITHFHL